MGSSSFLRNAFFQHAPWGTLAALGAASLVALTPVARDALLFDRGLVLQGEWWRVATGNFVHFGPSHLLWNGLVVAACGCWSERLHPTRARALLLLSSVVIGLGLLLFAPALARYAGLSGVAAALVAFLTLTKIRCGRDRLLWAAVFLALLTKVAWELFTDRTLIASMPSADIRPAPLAHALGALTGAAMALGGQFRPAKS